MNAQLQIAHQPWRVTVAGALWWIDLNHATLRSVTRVSDTDAFFYSSDGSARIVRFAFKSVTELKSWPAGSFLAPSGPWTHIKYLGGLPQDAHGTGGRVMFYHSTSGFVRIGRFTQTQSPTFIEDHHETIEKGWTHIGVSNVAFNEVEGPYVVFYDTVSGSCAMRGVANYGFYPPSYSFLAQDYDTLVPMGQTYVLAYSSGFGDIALVEFVKGQLSTVWSDTITSGFLFGAAENGVGARFHQAASACLTHGVRAVKQPQTAVVDLRTDLGWDVGSNWTHIVGLGGLP